MVEVRVGVDVSLGWDAAVEGKDGLGVEEDDEAKGGAERELE
jgi:hypothetical protein